LRHLPQIFQGKDHATLLFRLKKHLEKLPFFLLAEPDAEYLACQLSFWLCKPITLVEIIETSHSAQIIANAMYALLTLGYSSWVEKNLSFLKEEKEAKKKKKKKKAAENAVEETPFELFRKKIDYYGK
jgi:hypothetical protein